MPPLVLGEGVNMTPTPEQVRVPFSRRVIAVALAGLATLGLQKVLPGYHPDASVQSLIDLAVASAAGWAVTEEKHYLQAALTKLQSLGK